MKKLFQLLWLLAVPFLMSSCSEDDEPAPTPYSQLSSTVVYSKYTNDGYLPIDQPPTKMRVYSGDTLRYKFKFETNQGIKDFKVYDNLRGRDFHLMVGSGQLMQQKGVWVNEYTLEYLVNNFIVQAKPGEEIVLTLEAEDNNGTIYKDPSTGKVPEIRLTIAEPLVYKGVKLYNSWGDRRNSFYIIDYRIGQFDPQTLVEEPGTYPFSFLSNKMPPREWFDTRFERSFTSGSNMGQGKVAYVKVPAGGKNWTQPNQLALAMKQYGPEVTTVANVQVGDVYVFRVQYPVESSWVIYGIMEVKNIVDDGGDTYTGNGHDNDYMEFDIKYFPGYRY